MKNKINIRLIMNITTLVVCMFLLISVMLAWYVDNKEASANGISVSTENSSIIVVEPTIYTKRVNLNGDIINSEYTVTSSGNIYLTKKVTKTTDGSTVEETHIPDDKIPFLIELMLPGEYIDITIGFKVERGYDGLNYNIRLNNIIGANFDEKIDDKLHNVSGAFKYKSISLKDNNGNELYSKDTTIIDSNSINNFKDYNWFNTYDIALDDTNNFYIDLLNGIWNDDYVKLHYTFRIEEDFSQYYELISKASGSYGALLSNKNLIIDNIYFMIV